jgi:hypothetical protein
MGAEQQYGLVLDCLDNRCAESRSMCHISEMAQPATVFIDALPPILINRNLS